MINQFILGIAVILLTGLLFGKIAKKVRVPNVTGYLLGGVLIGPALLGFGGIIGQTLIDNLGLIVDIELGFIAFTIGCEFKVSYFKQVGAMPVIIAFAEAFAAVIFITGGIMLISVIFSLGVPLYFALAMGAVGGATAPAATIMVLRQYKAKGPLTQTIFSVVAIDDASALILFGIAVAIIKSIISPGASVGMTIAMPFIEIAASLGLGVISGFLLTLLTKFFKSNSNRTVLVIAIIFTCIGVCILLSEIFAIAISSVLACMAMGAVFCNTTKSKTTEEVLPLIESITPPLVVIFFIISGASLKMNSLSWLAVGLTVVYLIFRIAGKVIGTVVSAKACKAPSVVKKYLGFGLLPQGGIAIGLAEILVQLMASSPNVISPFNGQLVKVIVLLAVFASEIFGPILCKYAILKSGEGQSDKRAKKNIPVLQTEGASAALPEVAATLEEQAPPSENEE